MGVTWQAHPTAAAGMVMTPLEAAPPVPTLTVKAAVPLLLGIEGVVPKPEAMVGAVPDTKMCWRAVLAKP